MILVPLMLLLVQAAERAHAPLEAPAALRTTIRLNIEKVDVPADAKPGPLGNLGPLIAQLLMPDGAVEIDYLVTGNSTRGEIRGRLAAFTRGTIVLQRVGDDAIRVINPANRTWYALPASSNLGAMIETPDVQLQPTGEITTIAGQRAERFHFIEQMRIPAPEGVSLPPDFPRDIEIAGDVWSTDAFTGMGYASIIRTLQIAAPIPGLDALTAGGRFPLRIAVRSSIMPGYEIRSDVVSVSPASPAPAAFAVPEGYQQVQAPIGGAPR